MRVAIVRLTAMGDIIHTLASMQFVKKSRPDIHLTWFVEKKFAGVLQSNPHIDRIVPVDLHSLKSSFSLSKLQRVSKEVKEAGPFDLVIDVQGLLKSAILARVAGKKIAGLDFASAKEGVASLIYSKRFAVDCSGIAPARFAAIISKALGIEISEKALLRKEPYLFFKTDRECEEIESYFDKNRKNVVIVTAASNESKTYPPQKFAQVARLLKDYNTLLIAGSKKEQEAAKEIANSSEARVLPSMSLNALKYAISRCDLLIGGDTGPSHMAWALNRPSLLLFGSTPTSMMMQTPINRALASKAKVNPCRFDKSDRSIGTIEPKKVAEEAMELLK
ncbi:MAG: lipopolysaccharide heptosyltransferase I [Hydrogenimonas sp.]|nr:lipopolysaccharide heptosyltransferase I [Hydrogenimonas sp.]